MRLKQIKGRIQVGDTDPEWVSMIFAAGFQLGAQTKGDYWQPGTSTSKGWAKFTTKPKDADLRRRRPWEKRA